VDLKNLFEQKRTFILNILKYAILGIVVTILLFSAVLLIQAACTYSIYNYYAADHIEAYLNKSSENILLKSSNDTEIVQNIVKWECNEFISSSEMFGKLDIIHREMSHKSSWYLFLNKGNCGERGVVFEDMANRTGLTCRKIAINGFIDFNGNTENHAWSEVLINESEWVVADSGFNYSPPANHYFDYSKIWLLGPVYAFENGVQKEDRTTYYIPNTEEMIIKSTRDGDIIPNCSINIEMNNNGKSQRVVGNVIKLKTNESGLCPVTLGVYDNTSYTLRLVDSKGIYQYDGEKNIVLGNKTKEVEIEVNQPRPNIASSILLFLIILNLFLWKPIVSKKPHKKQKFEKL